MATNMVVGFLQSINKTTGRLLGRLAQIVGKDLVDIVIGQFTRNNRLDLQPRDPAVVAKRTRSRSPSKDAASAMSAGADDAPKTSRLRNCSRSLSLRISWRRYSLVVPYKPWLTCSSTKDFKVLGKE